MSNINPFQSLATIGDTIGKTAMLYEANLKFRVTISDLKVSYGNLRALVTPVEGEGEVWVNFDRLSVE